MVRSFILWLHGSGDCGPTNEPISHLFSSPEFKDTKWSFPTAPTSPVTYKGGATMSSWFDIPEVPITAKTVRDEKGVLEAVLNVHTMINWEVAAGTSPDNIFVCGFSQGGALAIASVLLYPKTLGGGVIFSGSVPLTTSIAEQISPEARKTPILWFHGMADDTVLFEAAQAGCNFLQQIGMNYEFKVYPDLDHSLLDEELQYFQSWIRVRLGSFKRISEHSVCCLMSNKHSFN